MKNTLTPRSETVIAGFARVARLPDTAAPELDEPPRGAEPTIGTSRNKRTVFGYLALVVALVACPCHLPLTVALLAAPLGGTAVAGVLTGNATLVFVGSSIVFVAALGATWWLLRSGSGPFGRTSAPRDCQDCTGSGGRSDSSTVAIREVADALAVPKEIS